MESQLAFIAICLTTAASPGPGMLAVLSNSINHNFRATLPVIFGISSGLLCASLLSNSWLLAVIHSDKASYQLMTWLCSGYIVYLGLKACYHSRSQAVISHTRYSFKSGMIVSLLNPKTLVFFSALFPLFIDSRDNFALQALWLTIELIVITLMVHISVSLATDKVSGILRNHIVWVNRITGILFIGLGGSGVVLS